MSSYEIIDIVLTVISLILTALIPLIIFIKEKQPHKSFTGSGLFSLAKSKEITAMVVPLITYILTRILLSVSGDLKEISWEF